MRQRNWLFSFMLIISVLLFAACGGGADEPAGTETEPDTEDQGEETEDDTAASDTSEDIRVTVGTGGTSGVYYPLGTAMAQQIFAQVDGISQARAVSTGASIANVQEMDQGRYEMALIQNDIAYYAVNGEGLAEFEGQTVDTISGMASLYTEEVQLVTAKDSGITSIDELEGKRIAVGDQGSGAEANARQILEAAGLTYDDIGAEFLGFGDAAQGLQNGTLDAAFVVAGAPTSAVQELGANKDVHILSLPEDVTNSLTEQYPYFTKTTIPAEQYADYGQENDIETVAVMAILIVNNDLSEDVVYGMTSELFENMEALEVAHARGKDITLDTALDGMSIDLHPGAQRYFDEQGISAD